MTTYLDDLDAWTRQKWRHTESATPYLHIFGVESNLGRESSWIEGAIRNKGGCGVQILREAWTPARGEGIGKFRSGVCTTNSTKQTSVQLLETLMQADGIAFAQDGMFDLPGARDASPDRYLDELGMQMKAWRKVPIPARTPGALEKFAYTGKAGADNKNCDKMRDDLLMSLLLNIYWLRVYTSGGLKNWIYD